MNRLLPTRLTAATCGLGLALYVGALAGTIPGSALARQARTADTGVFTAAQAGRGKQVYDTQCATCHGKVLEGAVGPLLTGDGFLTAWSGKPMTDLVDKIHKTMPLQAPGTLTRPQALDVTAYILQFAKFKTGSAELADAALAQVTMPVRQNAAAGAAAGGMTLTPAANLAQYMRAITFPNANIIFNVQVKEPITARPASPIPFDYVIWGNAQYYGWQAVDQAALALIESTPLFMMPGRRCENGQPVPLDRPDWKPMVNALVEAGQAAYRASQSRDVDAVVKVAEQVNDACANCHKKYRDVGAEGSSAGALRCRG
jgi:S-disulfanyl-L-cysteine oxidoreductase SoxD